MLTELLELVMAACTDTHNINCFQCWSDAILGPPDPWSESFPPSPSLWAWEVRQASAVRPFMWGCCNTGRFYTPALYKGLPRWHQWWRACLPVQEMEEVWSSPWVGKIPWRAWQPTLVCCLENSTDRGAWWAAVHRTTESQTRLKWQRKWLSMHSCILFKYPKPSNKQHIQLSSSHPYLPPNEET